jgi:hypothetical protein
MNIAVFGGSKSMPAQVPEDGHRMLAAFGGVEIDLSSLELPESLHLSALAFMGGVKLIVPRGTDVVMKGFALFGAQGYKANPERVSEDSRAVVYLNAVALFGGVEVIEA